MTPRKRKYLFLLGQMTFAKLMCALPYTLRSLLISYLIYLLLLNQHIKSVLQEKKH